MGEGGRDREGMGRGRKRRRETSEKREEGEEDLFFFCRVHSLFHVLLFSNERGQQVLPTALLL